MIPLRICKKKKTLFADFSQSCHLDQDYEKFNFIPYRNIEWGRSSCVKYYCCDILLSFPRVENPIFN